MNYIYIHIYIYILTCMYILVPIEYSRIESKRDDGSKKRLLPELQESEGQSSPWTMSYPT